MTVAIVLDSETTGIGKVDEVIQLAYFSITFNDIFSEKEAITAIAKAGSNQQYRPSVPIHPEAAKVNGIQYKDLLKCPASKTLTPPELTEDGGFILGHNISFDRRMMLQCMNEEQQNYFDSTKFICTLQLARALDKQLGLGFENHKLDTLMRHFYPEVELATMHDALDDCIKTVLVLRKLLEFIPKIESFNDLYLFQEQLKVVKSKGKKK